MQQVSNTRRIVVGLALGGCLLGGAVGAPLAGAELAFKVIAHPELSGNAIDRATLSAVFLRKATRWGDGTGAQPVDQSTQSPVRLAFTEHVHGQPLAAVMKYWMRQIADGQGVPPPVKESEADIIAHVASKKGAVGYVAAATPLPESVKVLQVKD